MIFDIHSQFIGSYDGTGKVSMFSRLTWLSTFMGHVDIQSTQVYLTITADLLSEANATVLTSIVDPCCRGEET